MTPTHTTAPPADATATASALTAPAPATLDAHGHDPAAYDWVPVLKKRRVDGWSPDKQRAFIEALADIGSVAQAAHAVDMSERSAQKLRRSPGAEGFDRAWAAAIDAASKKLLDEAFERALIGSDEPVFDRDGRRIGRRCRKSDGMLQFLLRGYFADRFGHAAHGGRGDAPPRTIESAPVAEALAHLHPEPPAEPHTLMAPDALRVALEVADKCDGKLPRWRRDPEPDPVLDARWPMGEAFERDLEDAKRSISGKPPMTDDEWRDFMTPSYNEDHYT